MSLAAAARWLLLLTALGCLVGHLDASAGDDDPLYRSCVEQCEKTGQIGDISFQHCQYSSNASPVDGSWYEQEPLYLCWKQCNCRSDCRYHCMMQSENEREKLGLEPVKYHGKWPFKRAFVFQEPVSAALSAVNLIMHFNGWLSFFLLVYYKLPLRSQSKRTYYEYTGLWHIYGLLAMNAWFWSAIFHSRDFDLTEKLECSAAVALHGYSLILAILRTFNVKDEASRVMVAAPLLAFVTTHILYLNFYALDHGLNMKVCIGIHVSQLLLWAIWAGVTRHPSRFKLWTVVFLGGIALLLQICDIAPYNGYIDAHALTHATTIPVAYLWWSFIKDDAEFRTATLVKKAK
uniref:Post-GPI attachment to proteins factor 3 n=1 Tax=Anthurium amnicola TaxID=1678845 RepID=A0A1D1XFQ2_9ARAE